MTYNLTTRQKNVLRNLVNGIRNDGWGETYINASGGSDHAILAIDGKSNYFDLESIYDMDALANAELIVLSLNNEGKTLYTITQFAHDAVDNDFLISEKTISAKATSIGVQINNSSIEGGNFQGIGYADQSEIKLITDNPENLIKELEKITSQLLDIVKNEINSTQLHDYDKLINEIKVEIQKDVPKERKLKKLLSGLSFINDTSSSIELVSKILPYLYPLLQLIVVKFS